MYITRHTEQTIEKLAKLYSVVLLTGARQVGKSTILRNKYAGLNYVTMDNFLQLQSLKQDPLGYLEQVGCPVIIDEVQRVPEAFINFKFLADKEQKRGMFFLTGSQKFALMKGVADSLAGRIGIVELLGLSNREINGDDFQQPFLPWGSYLSDRGSPRHLQPLELWKRIVRGSFPRLYAEKELETEEFYEEYLNTYLTRDVCSLDQVGDLLAFQQFMTALAARSGQLLNLAALGREVGVDQRTAKRWLSILEGSNIVYLLSPFSLNVTKRVVKTPKVYFLDTGLVCYLCGWTSWVTAERGAMAGELFETYVLGEILKSYWHAGRKPRMYFYRDSSAREIDLLFYQDNTLFPVEIKKTGTPDSKLVKNFAVLRDAYPTMEIGEGAVVCTCSEICLLGKGLRAIPVEMI